MKILFFSILLFGCSINRSQQKNSSSNDEPAWLNSPYSLCQEQVDLCAVGEAKSRSEAQAQARANLASIFEVHIRSELNVVSSGQQSFFGQSGLNEEVQRSLNESVNQILEAVEIKHYYKQKNITYALASLSKQKSIEILESRISKIDQELNVLWNKRSRTNLRKILKLYLERERLHERFLIVSNQSINSKLTYKDILEWRQSKPVVENLALRVGQAPDWMVEKIKELLTESGFRIVKGDATKAISLNVDSIKEFLNVEGFEKFTFTMNLTSFEAGEKNKVITISETVTGRTQADALLKVKNYFIDYLEQHLSDLGLD